MLQIIALSREEMRTNKQKEMRTKEIDSHWPRCHGRQASSGGHEWERRLEAEGAGQGGSGSIERALGGCGGGLRSSQGDRMIW
jgi:hypothetical protein